jgi:glycosyltransferase involved in cell wall biosynthesis
VVPPRDPGALATAVREVLELSPAAREVLGARARERIATEFSIAKVARRYEQLHADVAGGA